MTYADENLQEQETVNESTPSPNVKADGNDDVAQHFICIKEVRPVSRAKALRLKTGDVIVGIEGKTFLGSVEELLDIFDEINEEEGALLTIWRAGVSFNLIIFGPLGCVFEFTSDEVTHAVHSAIPNIKMDDIKDYTTFELLRNIEGECNIFDTRYHNWVFTFLQFGLSNNAMGAIVCYNVSYIVTLMFTGHYF